MNHRRLATVALAVVILLSVVSAGVAFAQQQSSDADDGESYSIDELREDGKHYAQPSARIVASEGQVYWLEHRAVNQPWKKVSKKSSGKMLGEDATLKTNSIYLRTIRASDTTRTMNVTLVYWTPDTREVTDGNATRMETYAAGQRVVHKSVTLEPGWSLAEIELPNHENATQVTMWLDEHPETARWTYTHKSVAFQQTIPFDSWSGFTLYAAGFVIVPALGFGAYGGRKVKSAMQKAKEPPGHGFGYYLGVTTLLAGGLLVGAYYQLAEVIVAAPVVLGLYVGVVYVGYMLATHEGQSNQKLFWKPHIQSVEAFSKSKIPTVGGDNSDNHVSFSEDMPFGQFEVHNVVDEGQSGLSIVRGGKLAFLARLKGGRARIENAHELKTRFSAWDSPWDEVFIVDPDADTIMDYEPPGLALKTPEIEDWTDLVWPLTLLGGGSVLAWQLASIYGPVAWATLLTALPILIWKFAVEGTDSHVHIESAAAGTRSAMATALTLELGFSEAKDLEGMEELAARALAQNDQEARERLRKMVDVDIDQRFSFDDDDGAGDIDEDPTSAVSDKPEVDRIGDTTRPDDEEVPGDD